MALPRLVLATAFAAAVALPAIPAGSAAATFSTLGSSTVSATWSADRVTAGTGATVSGEVASAAGGVRTVQLDLWLASGWRTLGSVTTSATGHYRIAVPTGFYRSADMRVTTTATSTAASATSARRLFTVVPGYATVGSASSWAPFSTSVRYRVNPCTTVGYRVNLTGAPAGGLATVKDAVARVARASGITFRYLGATTAVPPSENGWPTDTGLVIAWTKPAKSTWSMAGSTLGFGGPVFWRSATDSAGTLRRIAQGGVLIDSTENLGTGFGAGDRLGRVLMHEIGHAVGLGHPTASTQRMSHVTTATATDHWGTGDLTGMRKVGLMQGCVTDD